MFVTVGELLIFTVANWCIQLFLRHLTRTHQIILIGNRCTCNLCTDCFSIFGTLLAASCCFENSAIKVLIARLLLYVTLLIGNQSICSCICDLFVVTLFHLQVFFFLFSVIMLAVIYIFVAQEEFDSDFFFFF